MGQIVVPRAFGSTDIRDVSAWHHRYRIQTTIGLVLTLGILIALLGVVMTALVLATTQRESSVAGLLQALQPYILPTLGAVVGYAFGTHAAQPSGDSVERVN